MRLTGKWSGGVVEWWSVEGALHSQPSNTPTLQHSVSSRSLFLLVLALFRRAFADFLAIFQLAINGLVTAGYDLLTFLQAVGDLPVIAVADANLHRYLLHVIAFNHENHLRRFRRVFGFLLGFHVVRVRDRGRIGPGGRVRPGRRRIGIRPFRQPGGNGGDGHRQNVRGVTRFDLGAHRHARSEVLFLGNADLHFEFGSLLRLAGLPDAGGGFR